MRTMYIIILRYRFVGFGSGTRAVVRADCVLEEVKRSSVPFLCRLFRSSRMAGLVDRSFRARGSTHRCFIFVSKIGRRNDRPNGICMVLGRGGTPLKVIKFSCVLKPATCLMFTLSPGC